MSEPTVNVMLRLPVSVLAQLPEAVSAATGLPPPPNRAATVTAALGAFIVHSRQTGALRPPAPHTRAVTRPRAIGE